MIEANKHTAQRLVKATGAVMFFILMSRVLGLVREIVISYQFGTSAELDAYLAAIRIPDLLFNLVAGGALASAFIPPFTSRLAQGDVHGSWRLASHVINLVFIAAAGFSLATGLVAEPLVAATVGIGFPPQQQALTASLMRVMLIAPTLFSVSGILMGVLNANQEFTLPAAAPVFYNLAIIAGAIWLAPVVGVYGLALGVVAGAVLHLGVQVPWLVRHHMEYTPQLGVRDPGVREVIRLVIPRTVGIAAIQINFLVNTILASTLPSGSLAALNYAWLLLLLPVGVIAQAIGTVLFPTFSRQYALRDVIGLRRAFSTGLRTTWFLTIPASAGLMMLAVPLVRLLLERGAFDEQSTLKTAFALQFFAVGLFAHAGLETINRAFYALHDTATPVRIGVASVALNIILSLVLIQPLAQGGLALANSLATIFEMLVLLFLLRGRLGGIGGRAIALSVAKMVGGTLVMAVCLAVWQLGTLNFPTWVVVLGAVLLGAGVYIGIAALLKSPELELAIQLARGRESSFGQPSRPEH